MAGLRKIWITNCTRSAVRWILWQSRMNFVTWLEMRWSGRTIGLAIPRWRVLENGDTVIIYVTDADNNKEESAFKSASTWQVKFSNGKFGALQKLFDGAFHGGIREDNSLAVTGARILRARVAQQGSTVTQNARDTVWYKYGGDAEQACNVSLAKDGSKRTLFLDFGGKTGKNFVKKIWNA